MRLARHNNAYGSHTDPVTGNHFYQYRNLYLDGRIGPWVNLSYNKGSYESFRAVPVGGTRINGFRMPTAWHMYSTRIEHSAGSWIRDFGTYKREYRKSVGPIYSYEQCGKSGGGVVVFTPNWAVNQALMECTLKLKGQNIDLGTAIGESRKTFRMLVNRTTQYVQAYRAARLGQWSRAGNILGIRGWRDTKSYSNGWLEYQYGWKSLMTDIHGAQEQLKEGFRSKDQTFSASRQVTVPESPAKYNHSTASWEGRGKTWCRVKLWAKVENARLLAMSQLGVVNPALIAWELTRFSFLVDWILPVGDFIGGMTSTLGLSFTAGIVTHGAEYDVVGTEVLPVGAVGSPATSRKRVVAMRRSVLAGFPHPVPYMKSPFGSTNRAITAMALLHQTARLPTR